MKRSNFNKLPRWLQTGVMQWIGTLVIVGAATLIVVVGIPTAVDIYRSWNDIEPKERSQAGITLIQTLATIVGGIAIFWNIVLSRRQLTHSQEQAITDRFFKAVEQLGHEQAAVRVGSIYSLEQIARDSPRDQEVIIETLAFFIRDRRGLPVDHRLASEPLKIDRDVQAAVIVIGRRDTNRELKAAPIFLNYADLRRLSFSNSTSEFDYNDYSNTRFHCSDLREANFSFANLQKTRFWKSCLSNAVLFKANLSDADLVEADLQEADLRDCILTRANIQGTNLQRTKGLTVEQVLAAQNWKEAIYDPEFLALLKQKLSGY